MVIRINYLITSCATDRISVLDYIEQMHEVLRDLLFRYILKIENVIIPNIQIRHPIPRLHFL
jgi:hypothetical protein